MNSAPASRHITYQPGQVTPADRERLLHQKGGVVWFTGLSGSGKTTIARALEARLIAAGHLAYVLDGDNLRYGLNADLGFSPADRQENIRRVGEVAALLADAGLLALTAFISPYRRDRDRARTTAGAGRFLEVYLDVPLEVCARRDPKELYKRALAGEIQEFTGVSAPYEPPERAELVLPTEGRTVEQCVDAVVAALRERGWIGA